MNSKLSKADLQEIYETQTNVPFKIIGMNNKGFNARIFEFKAFVSFRYMPFEYESMGAWEFLFPLFKGVLFFAKIHAVIEDGECYLLNAKIPQFKTMELNHKTIYKGFLIHKLKSHCLIEMGASYNWKYGSIIGLLPNSKRDRIIFLHDLKIGDPISVYVYDKSSDGNYLVQGSIGSRDWDNGTVLEMRNKKFPGKISSHGGKKFCLVDGKYKGGVKAYGRWYKDTMFRYSFKSMINDLKEGDEITVQVIKFDERLQTMEVIWIIDEKIEEEKLNSSKNTIANMLGDSISFLTFDDE